MSLLMVLRLAAALLALAVVGVLFACCALGGRVDDAAKARPWT